MMKLDGEQRCLLRMLEKMSRQVRVIDFGCGRGRNLAFLKQIGFVNCLGVDISQDMVQEAMQAGLDAVLPDELDKRVPDGSADVVLLAHIIEHFRHEDLLKFLEGVFKKLKVGGMLIIATPLSTETFYNDFDHVRPYLPMGLNMMFGQGAEQVQYQSRHILKLEDIDFGLQPHRLQWFRCFYLPSCRQRWPIWVNRFLKLLYMVSCGSIGKKTSWLGAYTYQGVRPG